MTTLERDVLLAAKDYYHTKTNIDWEQRRYEIAKSALQGIITRNTQGTYEELATCAMKVADALIKELKK